MSFSKEVKEELARQIPSARHCQIAELAAMISLCGRIQISTANEYCISIQTENLTVARKFFTLVKKTFNIYSDVGVRRNNNPTHTFWYIVAIKDKKVARRILEATKLLNEYGDVEEDCSLHSNQVVQGACCKRAFIRGAFLAAGSVSNPEKTYHLEITVLSKRKAEQLQELLQTFAIEGKIVIRKRYYVVYVKEGSQIVDMLGVMEAHVALMSFENVRILKEMRNSINRQVNCETANINKTVVAATKQVEDILYIRDHLGLGELSEGLEGIARLRMEHPEASLKELGEMLDPVIGKSGVNHRLKKLSIIAEELRSC